VSDLPPEVAGRVGRTAFSSGLSVNDFASCLHLGLRPVALVQGYCVMRWSYTSSYGYYQPYRYGGSPGMAAPASSRYGRPGSYYSPGRNALSSYRCPHYMVSADHRSWGYNLEQAWVSDAWHQGFNLAYGRMLAEAAEAGAHGVIGVVDTERTLIDQSLREFHIYGTAVAAEGASAPSAPADVWTCYLAGPRLAKVFESGFVPTAVTAAMASVRMYAVCVTEIGMRGGYARLSGYQAPGPINQLADAQVQARRLVRDRVKAVLGPDNLHGADLRVGTFRAGEDDLEVYALLRGSRIRRQHPADPMPAPQITLRAND
jgi:hypothetical protein